MKEFIRNKFACFWSPIKFKKDGAHISPFPLCIRGLKHIKFEKGVSIGKSARIECYEEYAGETLKPRIIISSNTVIENRFSALVSSNLTIGKRCLIASDVLITTENHGTDPRTTYYNQKLISKDVSIGNNCWIGEKAIILPGVHLGNNVVVGAGSIVTKSFPSNVIIAGNPARIIKTYDSKLNKWISIKNNGKEEEPES